MEKLIAFIPAESAISGVVADALFDAPYGAVKGTIAACITWAQKNGHTSRPDEYRSLAYRRQMVTGAEVETVRDIHCAYDSTAPRLIQYGSYFIVYDEEGRISIWKSDTAWLGCALHGERGFPSECEERDGAETIQAAWERADAYVAKVQAAAA